MDAKNLDDAWWRLPRVLDYTAISRSKFLELVAQGLAPAPVRLPYSRVVVWRASDLRNWMNSLPPTRDVRHRVDVATGSVRPALPHRGR